MLFRSEKGDSAELVLDGKLLGERAEEVNLAELLASAVSEFDETSQTVSERALREEWPGLEARLREAMLNWGKEEGRRQKAEVGIVDPGTGGTWRPRWRR